MPCPSSPPIPRAAWRRHTTPLCTSVRPWRISSAPGPTPRRGSPSGATPRNHPADRVRRLRPTRKASHVHLRAVCPVYPAPGHVGRPQGALRRSLHRHAGGLCPNIRSAIVHRQVVSPLDMEREYGLTGGIFHGELSLDQLFCLRPVAGWARYRTPIRHLYLCGAGTHPGVASWAPQGITRLVRFSKTGNVGDAVSPQLEEAFHRRMHEFWRHATAYPLMLQVPGHPAEPVVPDAVALGCPALTSWKWGRVCSGGRLVISSINPPESWGMPVPWRNRRHSSSGPALRAGAWR